MRPIILLLVAALACGDDDASDASTLDAAIPDVPNFDADNLDTGAADVLESDGGSSDGATADVPLAQDAGRDVPPALPGVLYVNVGGSSRLAVVDVATDGSMVEREGERLELPRSPGAMTFDAARRRFFVGGAMRVFTVEIDAAGAPTLGGMTTLPAQPVYLSLVGDTLISAYFGADLLVSHDVSGAPPYREIDSVDVPEEPHAARPIGRRLYVPHRNGARVSWVNVAADGTFGELEGVDSDESVGPRHIAFHPSGAFAYIVNEFADTVSAYRVEAGALVPFGEATTTLPEGFDGDDNTGADIHVHPSGDFLYTSNRGHDSIAILDIGADGQVSHRETVPTEARPREFELSAAGHLLFGLGQDTGAVQSYVVGADGSLTPSERLVLGEDLRWGIFLSE
ncbi:MAG: 6-phosphogluconolactonase [Polyangiales bacterium]|jgi:6-phosphogluconolactonase